MQHMLYTSLMKIYFYNASGYMKEREGCQVVSCRCRPLRHEQSEHRIVRESS